MKLFSFPKRRCASIFSPAILVSFIDSHFWVFRACFSFQLEKCSGEKCYWWGLIKQMNELRQLNSKWEEFEEWNWSLLIDCEVYEWKPQRYLTKEKLYGWGKWRRDIWNYLFFFFFSFPRSSHTCWLPSEFLACIFFASFPDSSAIAQINSFGQYVLNVYYVSDTVLGILCYW